MKMKFNKRKWWHFGNKCITLEVSGFDGNPSIYVRVDGDERDVSFHIGAFIGIWLTFENFLPKSWYPKRWSKHCNCFLGEEREISFRIFGGSFWWDLWVSPEWASYSANKTWRKGCWHIVDRIKGKRTHKRELQESKQYAIPFLEGNYNVEVSRFHVENKWPRWFTEKYTTFNVRVGYYNENKEWVSQGVPVEGKGENSWDCDEDATYEMSFPGAPYRKNVKSCFDAALYFWHDMMKSREKTGSAQWLPEQFRNKGIRTLKKTA